MAYHSNTLHTFDSLSIIIAGGRYNEDRFTSDAESPVIFDTPPLLNANIEPPTGRAGQRLSPALSFAVSGHPIVDIMKAATGEAHGRKHLSAMVVVHRCCVLCCGVWLLRKKIGNFWHDFVEPDVPRERSCRCHLRCTKVFVPNQATDGHG